MGLFPIACASPMFALITESKGFLTPAWSSFSSSVTRMTRGPRTAYCIFLMHGFMLSSCNVAVGAMVVVEDARFLAKAQREALFCRLGLKLIIMMAAVLLLLLLPLWRNQSLVEVNQAIK